MKINPFTAACCLSWLISGAAYAVDYRVDTTESRDVVQSQLSRINSAYNNFRVGDQVNAFITISNFTEADAPRVLQANWYHCGKLVHQQSKRLAAIESHRQRGLHHAWFWIDSTPQIAGTGKVDIFADGQQVGSADFQINNQDGSEASCRPSAVAVLVQPSSYSLSSDALFFFDGSDRHEMYDNGATQIGTMARQIRFRHQSGNPLSRVVVTGYTDYMGDDNYNQDLSERRAETVKQIMVENGIPAGLIQTVGGGKTKPVKQCNPTMPRPALKECLAPNRRVEITIEAR